MSLAVSSKISNLGVSKTRGWGLSFFKECCFRVRVRVRVRVRLGLFRVRVRVSINSNPNPKTDSLKKRRPRPRPQPRPRVLPTPIESKEQNFFRLTIFTLNFGPFYAHRLTPFRPSYNIETSNYLNTTANGMQGNDKKRGCLPWADEKNEKGEIRNHIRLKLHLARFYAFFKRFKLLWGEIACQQRFLFYR